MAFFTSSGFKLGESASLKVLKKTFSEENFNPSDSF